MRSAPCWFLCLAVVAAPHANSVLWAQALGSEDAAMRNYRQGVNFNRRGLLVEAVVSLTEALSLRPDLAEAYLQRGLSFEGMGQRSSAEADFIAAIEHGSTSLTPFLRLFEWTRQTDAREPSSKKRYRFGIELAHRLRRLHPQQAAASWWEQGQFHELLEEPVRALDAYRKALDLVSEDQTDFSALLRASMDRLQNELQHEHR